MGAGADAHGRPLRPLARRARRGRAAAPARPAASTRYDGDAWLGLVPFRLANLRLRGLPPCRASPSSSSTSAPTSRSTTGPACGSARSTSRTRCCSRRRSATHRLPAYRARMSAGARRRRAARSRRRRDGLSFTARYRPAGEPFTAEPGLARALPDRALLPLHGRRRPPLPRRAAPRAVAAARAPRRRSRRRTLAPRRARGRAARAVRRGAGRARLAAGGALSPQRRTALVSVVAAVALVALKLTVGLASHSLGLISEAIHSGTDLVAALLTFFAVGVAAQPADQSAPVRARQGRAPGGARRGRVPRGRERLHRRARDRAAGRRRHAHGRRDLVGARGDGAS